VNVQYNCTSDEFDACNLVDRRTQNTSRGGAAR
jgi:hypothetical protein